MRRENSKTSLSGEEIYEKYLSSIGKEDKAILYTILCKLRSEGKEALKNLKTEDLGDGRIRIQKSRWKILGRINGERFQIEKIEDIYCR